MEVVDLPMHEIPPWSLEPSWQPEELAFVARLLLKTRKGSVRALRHPADKAYSSGCVSWPRMCHDMRLAAPTRPWLEPPTGNDPRFAVHKRWIRLFRATSPNDPVPPRIMAGLLRRKARAGGSPAQTWIFSREEMFRNEELFWCMRLVTDAYGAPLELFVERVNDGGEVMYQWSTATLLSQKRKPKRSAPLAIPMPDNVVPFARPGVEFAPITGFAPKAAPAADTPKKANDG